MNAESENRLDYHWPDAEPTCAHTYLWPALRSILAAKVPADRAPRIFDLGFGNGATASMLSRLGYHVTGIDPSEEGIKRAIAAYPHLDLHVGSAYDELTVRFGQFPAAVCLEVIEHVYSPRLLVRRLSDVLETGGVGVLSTPFHGYWKNLALAVTGKLDDHFTALWDGGHIKFWSERSLGMLLEEAGFRDVRFVRVGRLPPLAKSMIAVFRR